jgi:hypothetical protein
MRLASNFEQSSRTQGEASIVEHVIVVSKFGHGETADHSLRLESLCGTAHTALRASYLKSNSKLSGENEFNAQ